MQSIERLLKASKSTCSKKQIQGLESEYLVALFFHQKNYYIQNHRYQTPFAEVDLLIENSSDQLAVVEVKTIYHENWIHERISYSQKQRLVRARDWVHNQRNQDCVVLGAFVLKKQIYIYRLD